MSQPAQPIMTSLPAQQPMMGMNQPMMGTAQPMMSATQPMMSTAQPMMSQQPMMGQMGQQAMMGMMGTGMTSPTGNMGQQAMMGQPNMQQQVRGSEWYFMQKVGKLSEC